jgi:MarR family transcriptional regulator, organic hydroperoxide resistance regulator
VGREQTRQLVRLYPKIFFACHTRHVRDPKSKRTISSHQASVLDHLDTAEPMPLMKLAKHMGVTPSTMSISVERLVRQGYVRRSRDREDARRVGLTLTEAGTRVREANSVLSEARVAAMLERLSAPEREAALDGLGILARAAERFMEETAPQRLRWGHSRNSKNTIDS